MLQNFSTWLQTDPQAKKKVLFGVGAVGILILVGYVIFFLNFGVSQSQTDTQQLPNPQPVASTTAEVKQNSFAEVGGLDLVSPKSLGLSQRLFFNPQNLPVYVNEDLKLTINADIIERSEDYIPRTINFSDQNVIINEENSSSLYLASSKQFVKLPENIRGVTSLGPTQFLYFSPEENSVKVYEARDLGKLSLAQEFTTITPDISFSAVELRVFEGNPYLFFFQNQIRRGPLEVWSILFGKSKKITYFESVDSLKYGQYGFLATENLGTNSATTKLIDLSLRETTLKEISIQSNLNENKILGQMVAERCALYPDKKDLLCLIKEGSNEYDSSREKDVLVKVNLDNYTLTFPNRDAVFSGETVHISPAGQVYIVSQELRQLYRLKA